MSTNAKKRKQYHALRQEKKNRLDDIRRHETDVSKQQRYRCNKQQRTRETEETNAVGLIGKRTEKFIDEHIKQFEKNTKKCHTNTVPVVAVSSCE